MKMWLVCVVVTWWTVNDRLPRYTKSALSCLQRIIIFGRGEYFVSPYTYWLGK